VRQYRIDVTAQIYHHSYTREQIRIRPPFRTDRSLFGLRSASFRGDCHDPANQQHTLYSFPFFFINDTPTTEIYTLSLHDALPIWGNRLDTLVIDEPFYAYYLKTTGKAHPGAEEVIANGETDWRKVVERLTGPIPDGKRILYQKQMTHHLLPEIDREWIADLTNCFLIRDPREVILSYIKKNPEPTLEDLGYVQQGKIFDLVCNETSSIRQTDSVPPVVGAKDVLQNPERILRL